MIFMLFHLHFLKFISLLFFSLFLLTNALLKTPTLFLWRLALYFQKLLWVYSMKWICNTGLVIRLQLQRFLQSVLQFHLNNQCFRSQHNCKFLVTFKGLFSFENHIKNISEEIYKVKAVLKKCCVAAIRKLRR